MEERKWDYRGEDLNMYPQRHDPASQNRTAFGFTAALLESLPIVGLIFMVSNRVGAAMWAHGTCPDPEDPINIYLPVLDLEKHQHYVASERLKKKKG